jgi:hypothetical protein
MGWEGMRDEIERSALTVPRGNDGTHPGVRYWTFVRVFPTYRKIDPLASL